MSDEREKLMNELANEAYPPITVKSTFVYDDDFQNYRVEEIAAFKQGFMAADENHVDFIPSADFNVIRRHIRLFEYYKMHELDFLRDNVRLSKIVKNITDREMKLVEVLKFYADQDNFQLEGVCEACECDGWPVEHHGIYVEEHGDMAKKALAELNKKVKE